MQITITYLYKSKNIITINNMTNKSTVLDLKKCIFNICNISPENQILIFYGKCLDNDKNLIDYGIYEKYINTDKPLLFNYPIHLLIK